MEVHRVLGPGFLEAVNQEAMAIELAKRRVSFRRETVIDVHYKGEKLACGYKADFVCLGELIVEIKALDKLTDQHLAQVLNYLKASDLRKALLINFGGPLLTWKRVVLRQSP